MSDDETDASNEKGKEDNSNTENVKEDTGKHIASSPIIEAAKAENDRKEKLLEEEKKLMDRKEKLHAEQMVGGRAMAGQESLTPEEELQKKGEEGAKEIVDAFR